MCFLCPFVPTWELETKHKNVTARQLNYSCIESINGDMKQITDFTSTHFCTVTQIRKWMTESLSNLITSVLVYDEIFFKIVTEKLTAKIFKIDMLCCFMSKASKIVMLF